MKKSDLALAKIVGMAAAEAAKAVAAKHDSPGAPSAVVFTHGPQGNLAYPGVDQTLFNAAVGFKTLLGQLPTQGVTDTNPTYATMTGVQASSGDNPTDPCDNPPVAGLMKACITTSVFGRYSRATPEIDITRLGKTVDRADPMDLQLVGTPFAGPMGPFAGGAQDPNVPGDMLTNEVERKFWERNVAIARLLSQQLYSGNPSNNTAGNGYMELTGLQSLVATGYADAQTGVVCPAVDSYVRDVNFARVDAANTEIVAFLTDAMYQLRDRASRMALDPVRWVIVMRPQLFEEITAVWPCVYNTYRCLVQGQERVNLDGQRMTEMRDQLRDGKYLLIDGEKVPVVVDDGIPELGDNDSASVPAGCFSSDIYILPLSVVGGRASLFLQHFDYNNPSIRSALGQGLTLARVEGAFLTWPRQTNTCWVFNSIIEPRLVLRTPWLAARLQNVLHCPIQHTRDAFPDGDYFADGGATSRAGPSLYSIWQS